MEINKIYQEDCIEGMKKLHDNSIDYVITSPPYNLGSSKRGKENIRMYEEYEDNLSQDEYYNFIKKALIQMIRVTKKYVFFNFQLLSKNKVAYLKILGSFREYIKDIVIWHKKQWEPSIQPHCLSSAFEFIVIFSKKELAKKRTFEYANFNNRISGQQTSNVIFGNSASIKEFNSAQGSNKAVFPQYFVRWFIIKFTKENELILDPFSGSGTTALVCKQLNRRFIGFEISKEYCRIANKRLEQSTLLEKYKEVPNEIL